MEARMRVWQRVCLAIFLVSLAGSASAQQPGAASSLRGRVLDPQRRGVMARVQLVQVSTGLQRATQSDEAGNFDVVSIPPGDVDVIVSASGFAAPAPPRDSSGGGAGR